MAPRHPGTDTGDLTGVRALIDADSVIADVDPRLFGSFVEHLGRVVYGGIHDPAHATADPLAWRRDVLDLTRELGVRVVRYPGGNFVSGYDWEDGIGPVNERPSRLDRAWNTIESNRVGTDEFLDWARRAGVEPTLTVNLGTRGADAAAALVEYCNGLATSAYGAIRAANGHPTPWGVRLWCLGNEMDGPWQIGHTTADDYGRRALAAGRLMLAVDPSIELVLAGSSGPQMATFGRWDDTVLDLAWEVTDHLSVHSYMDPGEYLRPDGSDDVDAYLACGLGFERTIELMTATVDAVTARCSGRQRARPGARIGLSVDEWNVWHHLGNPAPSSVRPAPGPVAMFEDDHDLADALVVGSLLIVLLRHADRVRIACLAQLVNAIAPIRTLDGGPAWRQVTYYPVRDVYRNGLGEALHVDAVGPTYPVAGLGEVPAVDLAAVHHPVTGGLSVFAVNRMNQPVPLTLALAVPGQLVVVEHVELTGQLHVGNTVDAMDRVVPRTGTGAHIADGSLTATLPGHSWTMLRLAAVV